MSRILFAALVALALAPAAAQARPGDPDNRFGNRGTVTLKAVAADAVGGAVKVLSGNRVLAGGAAAGQFVVVKLRPTGSLDSTFGTSGQVVPMLPGSSLEGVRAIATFRDGRIVAAGTLLAGQRRRRGWWCCACCRAARSTRASAPGSGSSSRARTTPSSGRW